MAEFPKGLVSGEDAKRVHAARSKSFDQITVKASNPEALEAKIAAEKADGWDRAQKRKRSAQMQKDKPVDRKLEDDVWSILYKMGFHTLNEDRLFSFQLSPATRPRQIDIFAKDDETVFIVECTHSQAPANKSVKALIDKINGMRGEIINQIHAEYGKEPKLKVKFAIATKNIDWRKADRDRAKDAQIAIITEQDVDYYNKLCSFIKGAARYQFLARYLHGEGVDGLRIEVPATKGKMGGVHFYNFLISPHDLLKISYISHKAASNNDLDTYQRMVHKPRLKSIAQYIDNGGQFPTNIVINFKAGTPLQFERGKDGHYGKLKLPGLYGAAWIIDGQHRLYGFAFAERSENHMVSVLAYEGLPAMEEMQLFVDINSKQVKVPRSLLNELYSNLNHDSEDPQKRLEAQFARVALRLNDMAASPIFNRVRTVAKDAKDHKRCLTLTSVADGISENRFLGTVQHPPSSKPYIQPGPLSHVTGDIEHSTEKAADVLAGYMGFFAEGVPGHWDLGDAKGGFLSTNNGLRALFKLLKEIIRHVERVEHVQAHTMDASDLLVKVKPFTLPVIEFFKAADETKVKAFREQQALKGVKRNYLSLMGIVNETYPEFTNQDLKEYLDSIDVEGTSEADSIINNINYIIFDDVVQRLRRKYGLEGDGWFWSGVPNHIRAQCLVKKNEDGGAKMEWQYLSMPMYQDVISSNWDVFKADYSLGGKGRKNDLISWIGRLCKIKQTTEHPGKGLLTKDDVAWVRETYQKVRQHVGGDAAAVSA